MEPWNSARVDFGTLHRFRTSLGVVLMLAGVVAPALALSQISIAPYVFTGEAGGYSAPTGWPLAVVISSAIAFGIVVLASATAIGFGIWLIRKGLAGWEPVQALEDRYRRLYVDDFATRASQAEEASSEDVDQRIADEIVEEESAQGSTESRGVETPPPAAHRTDDEGNKARAAAGAPEAERRVSIKLTPEDKAKLDAAVAARKAAETDIANRIAAAFSTSHNAKMNSYWRTATRPQIVDLALAPKEGTTYAPIMVEVKHRAKPFQAERFADQLASVAAGLPRGTIPTDRGRPPIANANALLVVTTETEDEANAVSRSVRRFNERSETPVAVVARSNDAFELMSERELNAAIRDALKNPSAG